MCRAKHCDGGRRCLDLHASEKRALRRARQRGRDAELQVAAYLLTGDPEASGKVVTMSTRPSYFGTDDWAAADDFVHDSAAKHGVTLLRERYSAGMWLGEVDPAGAYVARAASVKNLHAWAAEVAHQHNQDSVMVATTAPHGNSKALTYGGDAAASVVQKLHDAGLAAGTTVDGRLQIISTPDAPIPGATHALLAARFGHDGTDRVRTAFVSASPNSTPRGPIATIQRIRSRHIARKALRKPLPLPHLTDLDDIAAATYYAAAADHPSNPRVERSYFALRGNVRDQWNELTAAGYRFEPWDDKARQRHREQRIAAARRRATAEGTNPDLAERAARRAPLPDEPYTCEAEMIDDLRRRKRLFYRPATIADDGTAGALPSTHPMAAEITVRTASGTKLRLPATDVFRVVHDALASGQSDGPRGQKRAWWTHRNTLPVRARIALWNETRAQDAWRRAGPHNVTADEGPEEDQVVLPRLLRPDEKGWKPLSQQPPAPSKCVDAPNWLV